MKNQPILCLDFDGVIHSYTSGWKGAAVIPEGVWPEIAALKAFQPWNKLRGTA